MAEILYTILQALDIFMDMDSCDDSAGHDTSIPVSLSYYL